MTNHEMRIGELARLAGINPRTLRYYERIGLLAPSARTAAGYRLYSDKAADRLAFIRRAQSLGLALAEIADIIALRDGGIAPCQHVRALAELRIAAIDQHMVELAALRADMVNLAERADAVEAACSTGSSICLAFEHDLFVTP